MVNRITFEDDTPIQILKKLQDLLRDFQKLFQNAHNEKKLAKLRETALMLQYVFHRFSELPKPIQDVLTSKQDHLRNTTELVEICTIMNTLTDLADIKKESKEHNDSPKIVFQLINSNMRNLRSLLAEKKDKMVHWDFQKRLPKGTRRIPFGLLDTCFMVGVQNLIPNHKNKELHIDHDIQLYFPRRLLDEKRGNGYEKGLTSTHALQEFAAKPLPDSINLDSVLAHYIVNVWMATAKGMQAVRKMGRDNAIAYFRNTADMELILAALNFSARGKDCVIFSTDFDIVDIITILRRDKGLLQNTRVVSIEGDHLKLAA